MALYARPLDVTYRVVIRTDGRTLYAVPAPGGWAVTECEADAARLPSLDWAEDVAAILRRQVRGLVCVVGG